MSMSFPARYVEGGQVCYILCSLLNIYIFDILVKSNFVFDQKPILLSTTVLTHFSQDSLLI